MSGLGTADVDRISAAARSTLCDQQFDDAFEAGATSEIEALTSW